MTGRIDRRALFTSGAAAALLSAPGLSAQAGPRHGGRLRIAVPRDGQSLELIMRAAVFDTLTEVGADGALRGELATEWRVDADSRSWEFDLRRDAMFHDGRHMTAEDVVESLTISRQDLIVTAVSKWTVRIDTDLPLGDLPLILADPALAIRPAGNLDERIGTGLYHVSSYTDGRGFIGKRCAAHYKDGRAGWFETVEVAVIPDAAVRAEALREGYVDVAQLPEPSGLAARSDLFLYPDAARIELAARAGLARPRLIGGRLPLDDGRISERWWML